jgi:plastocyanin
LIGVLATQIRLHGVSGATLRGRVEVRKVLAAPERRPGVTDLGTAPPHDLTDRRRAVVYLETAPREAFDDRDLPRATLDQRHETFVPHVLAIMAGTWVDFPNSDGIYHNVFSLSKAKRFDLGRYPQGKSKPVHFDRAGVVRVFCEIHSHMSAFILVFNHPYFATTDAEGGYHIDNIPAGTYSVAAWYEGDVRETRSVALPEGGAVEADFVVQ